MAYIHISVSFRRHLGNGLLLVGIWAGISVSPTQADGLSIDSDLDLGAWSSFASQWESVSTVCAWSDSEKNFYNVTASSLAAGSDFELVNDIGDSVAFSVSWRNGDNLAVWEDLRYGVLSNNTYAYATAEHCNGGPTAEVSVEVDSADNDSAMPGVYSQQHCYNQN